ncbi:hypothetical protein [Bradyrhizobium sp. B117]|uniref:hypothetical protein n=1 Tax=Bradyrhizobium sp. B117 TaxID=3140246 RepID=UPI003184085E
MADGDVERLAKIVLGETSGLTAKGTDSAKSLERLWSVVAGIAVAARWNGLQDQMKIAGNMLPADEAANYTVMKAVAEKISQNRYDGAVALPKQATLWQIDRNGAPSKDVGTPPDWIYKTGGTEGLEFQDKSGLTYRLYGTSEEAPGKLGFTSSYSLTGLAPRSWSVPKPMRIAAWWLGSIAALIFVFGGISAIWSGQSDGNARSQLRNLDIQYRVLDKLADNCVSDAALLPNWKRSVCSFLDAGGKYVKPAAVAPAAPPPAAPPAAQVPPAAASPAPAAPAQPIVPYGPKVGVALATIRSCLDHGPSAADTNAAPPSKKPPETDGAAATDATLSCELVVRSAVDAGIIAITPNTSIWSGIANALLGLRDTPGTRSIIVQFLAVTLGIAGLAIALGLGTKGRMVGIWVDERNRVSLARAQVTLWTIVALGGFATAALFNVGLGGPGTFPQIPASIAAALGIAFASPMISTLILNTKAFGMVGSPSDQITTIGGRPKDSNDQADRGLLAVSSDSSAVEVRSDPTMASLADVFVGEHVADSGDVDISRLQNVVLTVTLVLGYFAMLVEQLRGLAPDVLLTGIQSLPDPGGAFTSVLLISHATYLGTKAYKGSGKGDTAH